VAQLFQITHETSTTVIHASNYSGQIGSDCTIVTDAALAGTYGLQQNITGNNYVYKTQSVPASNQMRIGFRLRRRTLAMTDGDLFNAMYPELSNAPWRLCELRIQRSGANIQICIYAENDAGTLTAVGSYQVIDANAHTIEVQVNRATGSATNDGVVQWWLDGASIGSLTNVDNYDAFALFTQLDIGGVAGRDAGTSGIIDWDDVTMRDDTTVIFAAAGGVPKHAMQYARMRRG